MIIPPKINPEAARDLERHDRNKAAAQVHSDQRKSDANE
jgi:hypothetical protein